MRAQIYWIPYDPFCHWYEFYFLKLTAKTSFVGIRPSVFIVRFHNLFCLHGKWLRSLATLSLPLPPQGSLSICLPSLLPSFSPFPELIMEMDPGISSWKLKEGARAGFLSAQPDLAGWVTTRSPCPCAVGCRHAAAPGGWYTRPELLCWEKEVAFPPVLFIQPGFGGHLPASGVWSACELSGDWCIG